MPTLPRGFAGLRESEAERQKRQREEEPIIRHAFEEGRNGGLRVGWTVAEASRPAPYLKRREVPGSKRALNIVKHGWKKGQSEAEERAAGEKTWGAASCPRTTTPPRCWIC